MLDYFAHDVKRLVNANSFVFNRIGIQNYTAEVDLERVEEVLSAFHLIGRNEKLSR